MGLKTDLKKFTDALGVAVKEVTTQKQMAAYGRLAAKLIIARTRRGFGVKKTNTRVTRLARLAESTIERRRSASSLSGETSPGRSNLTFTGAMLNSIGVKKATAGSVIIGADLRPRS
jgi:hypothetical protein